MGVQLMDCHNEICMVYPDPGNALMAHSQGGRPRQPDPVRPRMSQLGIDIKMIPA